MAFRDSLSREIAGGPIAAALATRDAVRADLVGALALVDDPDEDMQWRVTTLLALALAAQDGVALPDIAADVLEDDLLVDAAIAANAGAAITGILAATHPSERIRKYLALRLSAAGATGMHVAALLLSVDDLVGADRAALPALVTALREHRDDANLVGAIASIVVSWLQLQPAFGARLLAALPADVAHVLAPAVRAFDPTTASLLDAIR